MSTRPALNILIDHSKIPQITKTLTSPRKDDFYNNLDVIYNGDYIMQGN